jgi:hypothetical protein
LGAYLESLLQPTATWRFDKCERQQTDDREESEKEQNECWACSPVSHKWLRGEKKPVSQWRLKNV